MSKLSKFNELVIGNSREPTDFSPIISSSGDFTILRGLDVILNDWNNILMIPLGSYTDDPELGSNLYRLIFESANENLTKKIEEEVKIRLSRFDDRASIVSVESEFNPSNKSYDIYITVYYKGETSELKITADESSFFA